MLIQLAATIYWMTTGAGFGLMITAFSMVGMAIGAVAMPLLILMLANPNEKVYDNGEDRFYLISI
jgi:hypothetical protein